MTETDTDRRSVYGWNNPLRDYSGYRWYNPVLWAWIVVDLLVMLRWWCWHKRQSLSADRVWTHADVLFALQRCEFVLQREGVDEATAEDVRDIRRHLLEVSEELNLESDQLERYTDDERDRDD